jgi:hypothetical protein
MTPPSAQSVPERSETASRNHGVLLTQVSKKRLQASRFPPPPTTPCQTAGEPLGGSSPLART